MRKGRVVPKKVVYLWGAGATHAEAQRLGSAINLLMRDDDDYGDGITTRILKKSGKKAVTSFGNSQGVDIEKLISLLAASGNDQHFKLAEKLRRNYFAVLNESLSKAKLFDEPQLAIELFTLHNNLKFRAEVETLSGIITTNHDGLLQVASQQVFGGVNPGFEFASKSFSYVPAREVPPILQLHGSFSWQFGLPIQIEKLTEQSRYPGTVWIPPTILKESKTYPFNKLTGYAYEILARQCDVLRVIGTSLTQNDWNVLSLIFNAQRHREATRGQAFVIELIMPRKTGESIEKDCAYLKNTITIGHLSDGQFADYNNDLVPKPPESDMANPFAYWVNQKIEFHRSRGELDAPQQPVAAVLQGATA